MKYEIFPRNVASKKLKLIKNENSPLDQIYPSSSILVNVPFLCM